MAASAVEKWGQCASWSNFNSIRFAQPTNRSSVAITGVRFVQARQFNRTKWRARCMTCRNRLVSQLHFLLQSPLVSGLPQLPGVVLLVDV